MRVACVSIGIGGLILAYLWFVRNRRDHRFLRCMTIPICALPLAGLVPQLKLPTSSVISWTAVDSDNDPVEFFKYRSEDEKWLLRTLWNQQEKYFPNNYERWWGLSIEPEDKEFLQFVLAEGPLLRDGFLGISPPCPLVHLSEKGIRLMRGIGELANRGKWFVVSGNVSSAKDPRCDKK